MLNPKVTKITSRKVCSPCCSVVCHRANRLMSWGTQSGELTFRRNDRNSFIMTLLRIQRVANTWGAFHYAKPTGRKSKELTKEIERYCSIGAKFARRSKSSIYVLTKILITSQRTGTANEIFADGTVILRRTAPTCQRGPALEVDRYDRKISMRKWKAFHFFLDRIIRKFWHNGKHPYLGSCCLPLKEVFTFSPRALTEANAKYAPTRQAVKETAQR